ncbi:unnamed protein product [Schistosoma margrebowiei]|uniref:Uncharacterized protein n=1 Tax=Schistosoma margrebowiei TaxID=48269 RepID=A0A183MZ59_9TREM|nr:unnamed protein product [Schistosoma margrebowiei]
MLNDLSSELSQHGAKTNPRGQCYACKKPINGTYYVITHDHLHLIEYFEIFTCTKHFDNYSIKNEVHTV